MQKKFFLWAKENHTTKMRQSICQKQEEQPAIALGNDMGNMLEQKDWKV